MKAILNFLIGLFKSKPKVTEDTLPKNPEATTPVVNPEVTDEEHQMCIQLHNFFADEMQEGITEYTTKGQKRIAEYHNASNARGSSYKTAWCSSMMCFACKTLGFFSTGKALARSWEKAGLKKISKPIKGCIVVFWRESKSSGYGHIATYYADAGDYVHVLGGNQSNGVNVAKYPKSRLIGYFVPKKA